MVNQLGRGDKRPGAAQCGHRPCWDRKWYLQPMRRSPWVLVVLFGCSSEAGPPAGGQAASGSAAALGSASGDARPTVTDKDRENVLAFFDEVGDRTAAAMKKVADTKPKSRIAYAEPMLLATPVAFPAHADLFEKHGLTLDKFGEVMADPAFEERALASVKKKVEPYTTEIARANLPEVDAEGCTTLARRLIELRQVGPSTAALGRTLAQQSFIRCPPVLPKNVSDCLPTPAKPSSLQEYDACIAKGAPAKK
jgi:hypothetical protein